MELSTSPAQWVEQFKAKIAQDGNRLGMSDEQIQQIQRSIETSFSETRIVSALKDALRST